MSRKKKKTKIIQLSPENYIKQKARSLPIYKCYITPEWKDTQLANIIISRKHVNNNITLGGYLVDLLCKGIKDSMYFFNIDIHDFEEMVNHDELIECDYTLAHNVIYAGLEFGEDNGFQPHKDFRISEYILEEDDDSVELIDIHVGNKEGKPLLTEHDPIKFQRDLIVLEKTLGTGNFEFIGAIDDEANYDDFDDLDDLDDLDEGRAEEMQEEIFTHLSYDILFPPDNIEKKSIIDIENTIESRIIDFDDDTEEQIDVFFDIIDFENEKINECTSIALQIISKYPDPEVFQIFIDALNFEYEDLAQILVDKLNKEYPNHIITLYYQLISSMEKNNTFDIEIIFDQIKDIKYIKTSSVTAIFICLSHAMYHLYFNNLYLANSAYAEALYISSNYEHSLAALQKVSLNIFSRKADAVFEKLENFSDEEILLFEQKMEDVMTQLGKQFNNMKIDE